MRTAAKVDTTQRSIVRALREAGISVFVLREGRGIPDLLCCLGLHVCLVECKTGKGKLNKQQIAFREEFTGPLVVTNDPADAVQQVLEWFEVLSGP